uniref:Uncharacterized protein n=1 Tax=viral metagenome TaxID=1070528 RepID=A0A6M3KVE4_9ZZZZ
MSAVNMVCTKENRSQTEPPIRIQLEDHENIIATLVEATMDLLRTIEPVMRDNAQPKPNDGEGIRPPIFCGESPVAQRLGTSSRNLIDLCDRIKIATALLEI